MGASLSKKDDDFVNTRFSVYDNPNARVKQEANLTSSNNSCCGHEINVENRYDK